MINELQIRRMEENDIPAVRELELQCFSDPWTETMLREMLESSLDSCFVLLSVEERKTAGYANVRVLGDEAELMRICVAPEFRGRGWSGPLLEEGMREMTRRGCGDAGGARGKCPRHPALRAPWLPERGGPEEVLPGSRRGRGHLLEPGSGRGRDVVCFTERMNGTVRLTVAGKDTECWIFVFSGPAA